MSATRRPPIKLFVFPRMFSIPNLSPFCCKMETWLRIADVPYEVVPTTDPRKAPRGKRSLFMMLLIRVPFFAWADREHGQIYVYGYGVTDAVAGFLALNSLMNARVMSMLSAA